MQAILITLAGLLFLLFSILGACHALLNKRDPKSALGWVACCLLLPYVGPLLYLVFGINRARTTAKKMRPAGDLEGVMEELSRGRADTRYPLSIVGYRVVHKTLVTGNEVTILVNGDEAYPAMLEAIALAKQTVYLATYLFARGAIADKFIAALKDAVERGVDVRIIVDAMGESLSFPPIGWLLRQKRLPFKRFNPFTLVPPSLHLNLRNHRKLLIVDGAVAFTGGMNIADKNLHAGINPKHAIQDIHFRVKGNLVGDLEDAFEKDWDYCSGKREDAGHHVAGGRRTANSPAEGCLARLVLDGPNEDLDKLNDILGGTISAARSRVWIMTPYFLPDAELIGILQAASLRNLDVKIVLPSNNNIPVVHWATVHLLWQLLKYGIEIWYQKPPFSHSKLLIIDDYYSLVGSANLDPRSMRLNYELSMELFSAETNSRLEAYFREKLSQARRYTSSDRDARSLPVQLRDAACWLASPYL